MRWVPLGPVSTAEPRRATWRGIRGGCGALRRFARASRLEPADTELSELGTRPGLLALASRHG